MSSKFYIHFFLSTMKTYTLVFVAIAVLICNVQADDDKKQIIDKLEKSHKDCQKDPNTTISHDDLAKLLRGENPDVSVYGAYVVCVSKNLKTQNEDGDANLDEIKKIVSQMAKDEKEADDFLKGCSLGKSDRTTTAKEIFVCFHNMLEKFA